MWLTRSRAARWLALRAVARGRRATQAERHAAATRWFRVSTRLTPYIGISWLRLARAQRRQGDLDGALSSLRAGLSTSAWDVRIAEFYTKVLSSTGRGMEAVPAWTTIFANQNDVAIRRLAMRRLHGLGALQQAEECARALSAVHPDDADALLVLAAQALRRDDVDTADALLDRTGGHGNLDLRRSMMSLCLERGDAERALSLVRALPEDSLGPAELLALGRLLDSADFRRRAYDTSASALKAAPQDPAVRRVHRTVLREFGKTAYDEGRYHEAVSWFQESHGTLGPTKWTWLWQARGHRALGDIDRSAECAAQALQAEPDWPPGLIHLADLRGKSGQSAESVGIWKRLMDSEGATSSDLRQAAWALVGLGEVAVALEAAERALRMDPLNHEAIAARALALETAGKQEDADALVATLSGTADPSAIRALVRLQVRRGNPVEAWRRYEKLPGEERQPVLLLETLQALRRHGEIDVAAIAARHALDAEVFDHRLTRVARGCIGEYEVMSGSWSSAPSRVGALVPLKGRILHVVGKSLPHVQAGYTVRTHHIVRAQRAADLDPHVVTQMGFPWDLGIPEVSLVEVIDHIPHHRLHVGEMEPERLDEQLSLNVDALADLVRRLRPAVLHAASDYRNAMLTLAVGRAFDLPVVYEVRGLWEETWLSKRDVVSMDSAWYRLRRERELACMEEADHVVTLSDTMKEQLVARGVGEEKISIVPNAVDPDAFQSLVQDTTLGKELGISDAECVVGYVSSFVPYEGIRFLIDATAMLLRRGYAVACLLVGDGEDRPVLEQQARALGVEDAVVFTGRVPHDDVPRYYGLIDVFVVPRTNDRVCHLVTPLKPFEAMAAGRALVVSGTDALRSLITPGETGLAFEPENVEDLTDTVEKLIRDEELRSSIGSAGRQQVIDNHTWEANARRYVEVYRKLGVL